MGWDSFLSLAKNIYIYIFNFIKINQKHEFIRVKLNSDPLSKVSVCLSLVDGKKYD